MSDDINDDDNDFLFDGGDDDPENIFNEESFGGNSLAGEEEEVRKNIEEIYKKLRNLTLESVSNEDLLKYIRVVNFNFAALSRLVHAIFFRQGVIEEGIFEIHKKVSGMTEANELIDAALKKDDDKDTDASE